MPDVVAPQQVVAPLLTWSRQHLRDLPWRQTRDPWRVLVSETMLQQTQVDRVIPRYHEFLERFPTARSCARAASGDVIELWAGLGYNRRAVNLWRAAVAITDEHNGEVPSDLTALLRLPGVGPYTARAVQVFAFEADVGVLDTNVGRLLARWTGERLSPKNAQHVADELVPTGVAWQWNQSLFDFANAVCTKRKPKCDTCPVGAGCAWRGTGPDPAATSAGVSTPQSTFEGSLRQVRGRIVNALRVGPVAEVDLLAFGRPSDTKPEIDAIVAGLIADGLAIRHDEFLVLPGSSAARAAIKE